MQNQPIETIERLIKKINPTQFRKSGTQDADNSLLKEWEQQKDILQLCLKEEALAKNSEDEVRLLVEHYIIFIGEWIDEVSKYAGKTDVPHETQSLYTQIIADLERLTIFIQNYFVRFLNPDMNVPRFLRNKFETRITQNLSELKERLKGIEKEPGFGSTLALFDKITATLKNKMTFRRLNYLGRLIDDLSSLPLRPVEEPTYSPLALFLISYKFNHPEFLKRLFAGIAEIVQPLQSDEEKLFLLKQYYKLTAQILECPVEPFFHKKPSAKELLLDWLTHEMEFLDSAHQRRDNSTTSPTAKINTSLSVPAIALLFRLLKEAGIVTNKNQSELFRIISATFTTQRNAEVATGHLNSKYYAIEESARRKMYDLLMTMAHLCKKLK